MKRLQNTGGGLEIDQPRRATGGDLFIHPHLVVSAFGGPIDLVDVRFLVEDVP